MPPSPNQICRVRIIAFCRLAVAVRCASTLVRGLAFRHRDGFITCTRAMLDAVVLVVAQKVRPEKQRTRAHRHRIVCAIQPAASAPIS